MTDTAKLRTRRKQLRNALADSQDELDDATTEAEKVRARRHVRRYRDLLREVEDDLDVIGRVHRETVAATTTTTTRRIAKAMTTTTATTATATATARATTTIAVNAHPSRNTGHGSPYLDAARVVMRDG
jgi:hypothetical protein